MLKKNKRKTPYLIGGAILVVLIIAFLVKKPTFNAPTKQAPYAQAFIDYADGLAEDGLVLGNEIQDENAKPFIFTLVPETGEISQTDVNTVGDLVAYTSRVLESRAGFMDGDIDIAFARPEDHRILLIKRKEMPELLSAENYGEMTIVMNEKYSTSLINLSGPAKNNNQDYADAWSVIQSICLAYTLNHPNQDPICNIFSANAAAGWVGIEQAEAEKMINAYGKTELEYLGSEDYEYRFIAIIYNEFTH